MQPLVAAALAPSLRQLCTMMDRLRLIGHTCPWGILSILLLFGDRGFGLRSQDGRGANEVRELPDGAPRGLPVGLSVGGLAAAGAMLAGALVDKGEDSNDDVTVASASLAAIIGAPILFAPEMGYWLMGLRDRGLRMMLLRYVSAGVGAAIGAMTMAIVHPQKDCWAETSLFCEFDNMINMAYGAAVAGGVAPPSCWASPSGRPSTSTISPGRERSQPPSPPCRPWRSASCRSRLRHRMGAAAPGAC